MKTYKRAALKNLNAATEDGARVRKNIKKEVKQLETVPDFASRLAALRGGELTDWEKTFLTSVEEYNTICEGLTKGQHQTFREVEARNTPEARQGRANWFSQWDAEKKARWDRMIRYYSNNTHYFTGVIARVNADSNYIPNEAEYKNVTENRWAVTLFALDAAPPKFPVGSLVQFDDYGGQVLAMVIEVKEHWAPKKHHRMAKLHILSQVEPYASWQGYELSETVLRVFKG